MNEQTHDTKINLRQKMSLMVLVVGVLLGLFLVFDRVIFQNRAEDVCREQKLEGICSYNPADCSPNATCTLQLQVKGQGATDGYQSAAGSIVVQQPTSIRFNALPGQEYRCLVTINDGDNQCINDVKEVAQACPVLTPPDGETPKFTPPPVDGGPSVTPTVTMSPPPVNCIDCVDGTFSCSLYESPSIQNKEQPSTMNGLCRAFSLQKVSYTPYAGVCPTPTTTLDCNKHVVVINTNPWYTERILSHDECELLKTNNFDLRLHTGPRQEGCLNYYINAYIKTVHGLPNYQFPLKICENCDLKSGCPISCAEETVLDPTKLIDIPDIQKNFNECDDVGVTNSPCYLGVGGVCGIHGTEATFKVCAASNRAKLWFDDPFNGRMWVTIDFSKDANSDNCVDSNEWPEILKYTYKNTGYYDTVLECKNRDTNLQDFYCAKRITRTCVETTTTPPPLTNIPMTPVSRSCPEVSVKLHLSCCSPTPVQGGSQQNIK